MLRDALVEALEAGGQERERLLRGQLLDDVLGQLASLRRQRDHAVVGDAAVDRVERRSDHVDAEHHAGPSAVRLVVDLPGAKRRRVAVREEPQVELGAEDGRDRTLLGEPRERMWDESEDIELHSAEDQVSQGIACDALLRGDVGFARVAVCVWTCAVSRPLR